MAKQQAKLTHSFLKIDQSYKDKNATFPDRGIDPAFKGPDYCRKWGEALYYSFLNNKTAWGADAFSHDNLLRLYSIGDQPVSIYQDNMLGENTDSTSSESYDNIAQLPISRVAKREGWLNVLWKPLSLAPKYINNILGMTEGADFDIFVNAIDSNSRELEETAKAKARVLSMNKDFLLSFKRNAGLPTSEEDSVPDNPYEIQIIESMDGFKVNYAKGMQKIVRHSMDVSKWDDVLDKKLKVDLLTIGRCATRDIYDPEEKKFKTIYIDPVRAGVQYSNDFDFSDAEYAFYCDLVPVSELRMKMPELSEQELLAVAEANYGLFGNPSNITGAKDILSNTSLTSSDYPWNDFMISVFHAEWMDYDRYRHQSYTNRYGTERFLPLAYGEAIPTSSTREARRGITRNEVVTEIRQPYQCSWLVGTKYVYDYGKSHMAPRPQPSHPRLSFHFEQLLEPSLMELLCPLLDQFQLAWYRYQNLRAQAIESGFAVDFGMLLNLADADGKKYPLDDVLTMWKQTGILPYMVSRYGNYQGGAVTPVTPIPNNLLVGLQGIQADFNMIFQLLSEVTGINPVALGQSPNPEAPVSTTEAALQATSNIIKPITTAMREIKENIATTLMSKIQAGIQADSGIAKAYELVVGPSNLEYIKKAEKSSAMYGIKMEAKPDQLFKQSIVKYIQIALQNGRDGKAGVDLPEAMLLEERLLRGEDITQLRQDLAFFLDRSRAHLEQKEKENIQLQNQGLQQLEAVKGQVRQQEQQGEMMINQSGETEKRKTERLKQNYQFINKLMETAQQEQAQGIMSSPTMERLRMAMEMAGNVDLSQADLPTMVAQRERMMGASMPPQVPQAQAMPQQSFPPMTAGEQMPTM